MGVCLWPWDYAAVVAVEVAKFTEAKKSASSSQQCQVHVDRFFLTSKELGFTWPCSLRLFPIPQDEITTERASFWQDLGDPCRITRGYRYSHVWEFQGCMKSWETCWDCCTVYMPKGTTLKEMVENRSYSKKLFLWPDSPKFWVAPHVFKCFFICLKEFSNKLMKIKWHEFEVKRVCGCCVYYI
jgi:hypothetical protein